MRTKYYAQAANRRRLRLRQRAAGLHRLRPDLGEEVRRRGPADRRRRHQVAGRCTIVHRALAKLFEDRGVELLRTYQLNFAAT